MSEPAGRPLLADLYARIVKSREALGVPPNLSDYERVRDQFTWDAARALLDGLPGDGGLNIAHEAVDRHANGPRADRQALRWIGWNGDQRIFTYRDLKSATNRFANALRSLGVREGDSVFVLAGRIAELYIAVLGGLKAKCLVSPLFSAFGPEPLATRLTIGEGRVLVTTEPLYRRKVAAIRAQLPKLERVILVPEGDAASAVADTLDWNRLVDPQSADFVIPPTDPEDRALLHFTSGTTGRPKGAIHVHAAVVTHHVTGLYALDLQAAEAMRRLARYAVEKFAFDPDGFVHELVDAIIGDNYPVPDRMLFHAEKIVHEYVAQAMCGMPRPAGRFDLFAVEDGTAAMCYIFRSLKTNRLLLPGDRIALGTPIFTPYLEIPELEDYELEPVYVQAPQENGFQFTDAELAKLEDPRIKAFFLVNPGNPTSVAISPEVRRKIAALVRIRRPDLMLFTDDVYATFVDGFRSLLGELPHNTIGVYSYSKYFGCTGWRLGVIAIHQDNVFDRQIAALPEPERQALDRRYGTLALEPRKIKFIDRLVADSRDVALNHTAGLSPPQQAMMTPFSLVELADQEQAYRGACIAILRRRVRALLDGLGLETKPGPLFDNYYGLIDLEFWLRQHLGEAVVQFVKQNIHPLDIVFRLARDHGIVLLNGGGFHAPDWSVRVSFANLDDAVYADIGRAVRAIARDYMRAYRAAQQAGGAPPVPKDI